MHYRYPTTVPQRRALGMDKLTFEKFTVVGHSWLPESWVAVAADAD